MVELAPKVLDGTRCYTESLDMCISGLCQVWELRDLHCFLLPMSNHLLISIYPLLETQGAKYVLHSFSVCDTGKRYFWETKTWCRWIAIKWVNSPVCCEQPQASIKLNPLLDKYEVHRNIYAAWWNKSAPVMKHLVSADTDLLEFVTSMKAYFKGFTVYDRIQSQKWNHSLRGVVSKILLLFHLFIYLCIHINAIVYSLVPKLCHYRASTCKR